MCVLQRVVDFEFFVFAQCKCVVGEYFNALDVMERTDEIAGARERFIVVADSRDEHVANPDGLLNFV